VTAINRAPVGWLGFLGIKNFGRNPAGASDVLAPTWDLAELYLAANRTWVTAPFTITGIGRFPTGQVPAGQVWRVDAYAYITNVLAAGNTVRMSICTYNAALDYPVPLGGPVGSAIATERCVAALARPIILQPGESLGAYVESFAGANIPGNAYDSYTRLDA